METDTSLKERRNFSEKRKSAMPNEMNEQENKQKCVI